MTTVGVVLAAGLGTRMRSGRAKVLHEVGGLPLVAWSCRAAAMAAERVVVVIGHEREAVRSALAGDPRVAFAVQDEQLGTGHAVSCAASLVASSDRVLVLAGDVPRLRGATLAALVAEHEARAAAATVLTFRPADPAGYGRIVRGPEGAVAAIVEHAQATLDELAIGEVNSGIYAFETRELLPRLEALPAHGRERYLTDVIASLVRDGATVAAREAPEAEVMGVNTQAQLAEAEAAYRRERVAALMEAGVTVTDPLAVAIDADVVVGPGTTLRAPVALEGATAVGARCEIGPFVRLRDARVGDGAVLRGPLALDAATVPPGARLP